MPDPRTKFELPLLDNQSGFVLVLALLILVVLVIVGTSTNKDSQLDLQIVGNDKINKQTFFRSESGTELGSRMIEEGLSCPNGFSAEGLATLNSRGISIANTTFWQNTPVWYADGATPPPNSVSVTMEKVCPSPKPGTNFTCYANQAIAFTSPEAANWPTNISAAGTSKLTPGSAITMLAGYKGKGRAAAAGGGVVNFADISMGQGASNSAAGIEVFWQHMIGQVGECNY